MKKILFFVLIMAGGLLAAKTSEAQATKVGVFDIEIMVQAMPGYDKVDSLVKAYEEDSLTAQYQQYMSEYSRLDSLYKIDSAAKRPPATLDFEKAQKNQIGLQLVYWQQYAQQMSTGKRQQLAAPLYQRVVAAYSKVLQTNNYLVVLKPGAYEMGSKIENIFEKVAKELKVTLPDQLRSAPQAEEKAPVKTGTKPVKKS